MKYIVGARGSQLSVAQTNWVITELKKTNPDTEYEIKTITTKGDTDTRPLFTIDQKGIFIAPSQFEVVFLSDAHTENDLNKTLDAYHAALKSVKN